MITGRDFQDWHFRNSQENEHEAVTAARFARHCVEQKQAEIDALKAQNAELISAFSEVLRIGDRQHDAWDAAKAAIAKARGDL